jgi:aldehyde dehydrogenase (NAD+)
MRELLQFFINGQWVSPATPQVLDVINPATGTPNGRIALGGAADVDAAVKAARAAFPAWSATPKEERMAALERIAAEFERRLDDMGVAIREEMGAPQWLARDTQASLGPRHFRAALNILRDYEF